MKPPNPMERAPAMSSANPPKTTTLVSPRYANPAVSAKGTVIPSEIPIMASEIIRALMRPFFCFWPSRSSSSDSDVVVSSLSTSLLLLLLLLLLSLLLLLLLLLFFLLIFSSPGSCWSEEEEEEEEYESGTETTLLRPCFSLLVLSEELGREV